MNEVQIQSEEQQVERKEVCDFTYSSFHKYWIYGFTNIGLLLVFTAKVTLVNPAKKYLPF